MTETDCEISAYKDHLTLVFSNYSRAVFLSIWSSRFGVPDPRSTAQYRVMDLAGPGRGDRSPAPHTYHPPARMHALARMYPLMPGPPMHACMNTPHAKTLPLPNWSMVWKRLGTTALDQRSPTLGLQMFLDFISHKSWPVEVVVKPSGRCSPRTSGGPRLGTTALDALNQQLKSLTIGHASTASGSSNSKQLK